MMPLRELQLAFLEGTLHERPEGIRRMIVAHGLAPERRLAIYRNNAREGFLQTLSASFPVVARLAGNDWFRQSGLQYMRENPSRSGNLHHIGERFARFLQQRLSSTAYRYFADVARLEWAYQEVLVAAERAPLDVAALARVAPEQYDALVFEPCPALQLVESPYPVLAIWKANQPDTGEPASIALDAGASRILVIRRADHVELRELDEAEFALLTAFGHGATLEEASEAMQCIDARADLSSVLARLVRLQTLADFTVRDPQHTPHSQPSIASVRDNGVAGSVTLP